MTAILVAAVVTIGVVAFGIWALTTTEPPAAATNAPTDPWADYPSGFTRLPDPPLSNEGMVRLWGDGQFFIWGGHQEDGSHPVDQGYLFDVASDAWRPVPEAPLDARSHAGAVWSGQEFIIWGGGDFVGWPPQEYGGGAAYDPATDAWREIAPAPIDANIPLVSAWTGTEMIVWGDIQGHDTGTGAAYDPQTDSWRVLPQAPESFTDADAVWTGTDVVVFGARLGPGNFPETAATGMSYTPATDSWRMLPESGLVPNSTEFAWDGQRVVAMDYGLRVQTLDGSADRWVDLPRMPANACEGGVSRPAVGSGTIVMENCGELLALDPGAERWRVLLGRGESGPSIASNDVIDADGAYLMAGWEGGRRSTLWAYKLPPPSDARRAWDVAAGFAAIRSHYPYDHDAASVQDWILDQFEVFISPTAAQRYEERERTGLSPLWTYYWGFRVLSVDPIGNGRFAVVVRLERGDVVFERLTIGPGAGLDGLEHDMVILDAEPTTAS